MMHLPSVGLIFTGSERDLTGFLVPCSWRSLGFVDGLRVTSYVNLSGLKW
jgi:hypothetical protein